MNFSLNEMISMKRMLALGELSAINYIYVVQKYREKLQKKKESSQ